MSEKALANEGFYYPPYPYPADDCDYDSLDAGIRDYVRILRKAGIETYESCEGGEGHAYPEPTIRFHGERGEGFRAISVAFDYALPVACLRRVWVVQDGELVGPEWEVVFWKKGATGE